MMSPFPVLTELSLHRARTLHSGPNVVGCVVCGHPSVIVKPTRKPGILSFRCATCGLRAMTDEAGAAWWVGRGVELRDATLSDLREYCDSADRHAGIWNVLSDNSRWPTVKSAAGVTRKRCPRSMVCFACGEHAGMAQLDKHGRPYITCRVCKNRMFLYRREVFRRLMVGLSRAETEAGARTWLEDHMEGRRFLASLLRPAALSAGAAVAEHGAVKEVVGE